VQIVTIIAVRIQTLSVAVRVKHWFIERSIFNILMLHLQNRESLWVTLNSFKEVRRRVLFV